MPAKRKAPAPTPTNWETVWKGSILEFIPPDGFSQDGRRILAECPEFRLVELWKPGGEIIVERAPAIEAAYWKAVFRIIDRDDSSTPEERLAVAAAVAALYQFTKSGNGFTNPAFGSPLPLDAMDSFEGRGGQSLACRFAHTIGRRLMVFPESEDVKGSIDDCARIFKSALSAFAVSQGLIPDARTKTGLRLPIVIITTAEEVFRCHRRQPSKSEIQTACESRGLRFGGKDPHGRWADAFNTAGLGNLPDFPTS